MRIRPIHSVVVLILACGSASFAGEHPLAGLPSSPGPQVEQIKALGDNAWLDLGKPAPDPKWGMGRGRAYSPKMAYAPDLNGAFFAGCGVHGYVKPDGHYMDDLFFYDAAAHRWICLHPGASKQSDLKLDEHGFEVTQDGIDHPVSYLSHAYNMVTYNGKLKKYMLIYHACPWWTKAVPQRAGWLGVADKDRGNPYRAGKLNADPKHPVFWNVDGNRWERLFVAEDPSPGKDLGVLEYIPEREQAFYMANRTAWFFDFKSGAWIGPKAQLKAEIKYDYVGCYDAKRGKIYVLDDANLFAYDLKEDRWAILEKAPLSFGNSTRGQLTFDTASGMVIGISFRGDKKAGKPGGVYVYDPDKNTWSEPASNMPALRGTAASFYHAEYNVHYVHVAGDSRDDGKLLVYRYRKADSAKEEK